MTKFDKGFNVLMTILFVCFAGLYVYLAIEMNKAEKANNSQQGELLAYQYKVTQMDSTGLYGVSVNESGGIYITLDKLQPTQDINVNDVINVYFNKADLVEGIEHIEVLANGQ